MKKRVRIIAGGGGLVPIAALCLLTACSAASLKPTRWYTAQQLTEGAELYEQHCASCHGARWKGGENWNRPLSDGSYPPPPLDGSAHSWHHPLSDLVRTVREGGTHPGGVMPAFADILSPEEQRAAVAGFQRFWSDQTYSRWLLRGGLD